MGRYRLVYRAPYLSGKGDDVFWDETTHGFSAEDDIEATKVARNIINTSVSLRVSSGIIERLPKALSFMRDLPLPTQTGFLSVVAG